MEPHAINIVNENIEDENSTCTTDRSGWILPTCAGSVAFHAAVTHAVGLLSAEFRRIPNLLVKLLFSFRGVGLDRSARDWNVAK